MIEDTPFIVFFFGVFWYVSLQRMIVTPIETFFRKKRCTARIVAKVVDIKAHHSSEGGTSYTEVYNYYYNGRNYSATSSKHKSSMNVNAIDSDVTLNINPDRPDEIFEGFSIELILIAFMIVPFLVMPLWMVLKGGIVN